MPKFPRVPAGLLGMLALAGSAAAQQSPEGYWLTAGKNGIIELYRCGDSLCGKLAWFRIKPNDPNPRGLDLHNPDPARRNQPLCGLTFMTGFRQAGADNWEDGTIYDPESGNTYHGTMTLQADGALRLRGYIGISLIGRSEQWSRYAQALPACPTR